MWQQLLKEIQHDFFLTRHHTGLESLSPAVENAMAKVDRAHFVTPALRSQAYANHPLPIGCEQTISQPFIVALMSECLYQSGALKVLEVGTGCGYQTAVLCHLFESVYSIEVLPELAKLAETNLADLAQTNLFLRQGNGRSGWPEAAPFDGIIVTAAAPDIPTDLLDQLADGGRMVIPVDMQVAGQVLKQIDKQTDATTGEKDLLAVRFVPLVDT